jgi:hypothetical protein
MNIVILYSRLVKRARVVNVLWESRGNFETCYLKWIGKVGGIPRALLAEKEVGICMWKSTPLTRGSVSELLMCSSFIAN